MINFCDKCGEEKHVKLFPITKAEGVAMSNMIICQECIVYENVWRRQRNRELPKTNHFDMMLWPQGKELT